MSRFACATAAIAATIVLATSVALALPPPPMSRVRGRQQGQGGSGKAFGVDLYLPYPTSTFQCLALNGVTFGIYRGYHSYGAVDQAAPINLNNAKLAGIQANDIYHFPATCVAPEKQVRDSIEFVGSWNFGTLWFDIEENPSAGCGWSTTNLTANCDFLKRLIAEGVRMGMSGRLGIYSSHWEWPRTMGDECTAGSDAGLPLWYAAFDNSSSFDRFASFGGWRMPAMKQYSDATPFCGVIADRDFYPM